MKNFNFKIAGKSFLVEVPDKLEPETTINVNGIPYTVEIGEDELPTGIVPQNLTNVPAQVTIAAPSMKLNSATPATAAPAAANGNDKANGLLRAPMPGKIIEIKVAVGDRVTKGEVAIRFEAMKMENNITIPYDGIVKRVMVHNEEEVHQSAELIEIEAT